MDSTALFEHMLKKSAHCDMPGIPWQILLRVSKGRGQLERAVQSSQPGIEWELHMVSTAWTVFAVEGAPGSGPGFLHCSTTLPGVKQSWV